MHIEKQVAGVPAISLRDDDKVPSEGKLNGGH